MPFHLVNKLYNVDNTEVQYPITWSTFKSSVEKLFQEKNYEMVVHNHTFSTSGENTNISWTINISGLQDNLADEEIIYFIPNRTYLVHITFQNTIINLDSSGTSAFTMNYINPSVSGTFHLISQLQSDDEINVSSDYPYQVNTHSFSFAFTCPSMSGEQDNIQADAQLVLRNLVGLETSLLLFNYIIDITPPELTTVTLTHNNNGFVNAKQDSVITLTITSNESITEPSVLFTISGTDYNPTSLSGSDSTWNATYTVENGQNGTVSFTVDYTDLAGNSGVQQNQSTNGSQVTIDTTLPTLSSATIESSNNDATLAKEGDIITLNLTSTETITTPSVTFNISGTDYNPTTLSGSDSTWTATYTVENGQNGMVAFTVDYIDLAGNAGIQTNQSTNNSSVTVDTIPPSLSTISITNSNSNNSFAKQGDIVTLNLTFSEAIESPTIKFMIEDTDVQTSNASGSDTNWVVSYTIIDGNNGALSYKILNCVDLVGNSTTFNDESASITVKTTIPEMTEYSIINASGTDIENVFVTEGDVLEVSLTFDCEVNINSLVFLLPNEMYSNISGASDLFELTSTGGFSTSGIWEYTVQSGDTNISFELSNIIDRAGNTLEDTTEFPLQNLLPILHTIEGENSGDRIGYSTAINANDNVIAISAPGIGNTGVVRVYTFINNVWVQKGGDITGPINSTQWGISLSLNTTGDIVAISDDTIDGTLSTGLVQVFEFNSNSWTQKGGDITTIGQQNGIDISLDSSGNTIAFSTLISGDMGGGRVHIREYDGFGWVHKHTISDSDSFLEGAGRNISLNDTGNRVAFTIDGVGGFMSPTGTVKIYEKLNSTWSEIGSFEGAVGDKLGWGGVSLNSAGDRVAFSSVHNDNGTNVDSGYVSVYEYQNSTWTIVGASIIGESSGTKLGFGVSLDSVGDTLAVGTQAGPARIYQFDSDTNDWIKKYENDINVSNNQNCIQLSKSGNALIVGNDTYVNGNNKGSVVLYEIP